MSLSPKNRNWCSAAKMSALGHKQTYAVQKGTSALPPIATTKADSRKTVMSSLHPKADIGAAQISVR
jgi:hypothetical protein